MLTFCFFLFNDKKKARPAGHDQPLACAEIESAATPNSKGQEPGRAGSTPPTRCKRNPPNQEKDKGRNTEDTIP
ncbi:MAG: hypothetical protein FWE28_04920 [Oscillospiraceae bacterium]|nr:hypothetical protein [Oscillospiraceae bacterium]